MNNFFLFIVGPRRRTNENVVPSTTVPLSDARLLEEEKERIGQHHDQSQLYVDQPITGFTIKYYYQKHKIETDGRYQVMNDDIYLYIYICFIFNLIL